MIWKHKGFSLIEVLISIFVISVGLLGAAGLQIKGIQQAKSSYLRSQASIIAYDMADRMRANPVGRVNGNYNLPVAVRDANCLVTVGCSTANLANHDFFEWTGNGAALNAISDILPGGRGIVCIDSTPEDGDLVNNGCDNVGSVYAIKVWWTDDRREEVAADRIKQFVTTVSF
ncbi:type IV pilus modification protein PilV [Aliamphritea ceti]|uniref:type IV pilus modification protein PilV n=1 Tax=Aliamphritea ceti TaxID=1524258 RepID=UPI0021C2852E|nr:type IV pilus modification protein PilV [Aliamphritea ceti]